MHSPGGKNRFSRRAVGWSMTADGDASLVMDAKPAPSLSCGPDSSNSWRRNKGSRQGAHSSVRDVQRNGYRDWD